MSSHYRRLGFILSLQFTKNAATGAPYYSSTEVNQMLSDIDNFWTVSTTDLSQWRWI